MRFIHVQRSAIVVVDLAAIRRRLQIELRSRRERQIDIAGARVHFDLRYSLAGPQLDVPEVQRHVDRLADIRKLHMARPRVHAHGSYHVVGRQFPGYHVYLAGKFLQVQRDLYVLITQRLRQIAELHLSHICSADRYLAADVLQFDILPAALQIDAALHADRPNDIALAQVDAHAAANVFQPHAGIVAGNIHFAIHILDIEIAQPSVRFNRRARQDRDLQLGRRPHAVAHAILVGANDHLVALLHQFERRFLVGAVGLAWLEVAEWLAPARLYGRRVRHAGDFRVPAEILDQHAAALRTGLLRPRQRVVEALAHVDYHASPCATGREPVGVLTRA